MKLVCPNKNTKEWKDLVNQYGEEVAYYEWQLLSRNENTNLELRLFSNNNQTNKKEYKWSNQEGYEVSSKGDKRFSALFAKLKDGRTIEEAYQLDVKGYRSKSNDWRLGKGKPPIKSISKEQSWKEYKQLWKTYLLENPNLIRDLQKEVEKNNNTLRDSFANTDINQARALSEILNESIKESNSQQDFKSEYNQLLDTIFNDVKSKTANVVSVELATASNNNPLVKTFKEVYEAIGYGAMIQKAKAIIVSENRPIGTEYHEAFHAWEKLIFTANVRNKLYDRVRKLTNETLSDEDASERLAEMYRVYATKQKLEEIKDTVNRNFFEKIMKFLNDFFNGLYRLIEIDEKQSLERGVLPLSKVFQSIYRGERGNQIYSIEPHEEQQLLDNVTLMYNQVLKQITGSNFLTFMLDDNYRKSTMRKYVNDSNVLSDNEVVVKFNEKIYNDIFENTNIIIDNSNYSSAKKERIKTLFSLNYDNIKTKHNKLLTNNVSLNLEEENSVIDETERTKDYADISAAQIDEKNNVSNVLQFLFKSFSQRDSKNGIVKGSLGLSKPVSFNDTHLKLHELLAGSLSYNEMISRLEESEDVFLKGTVLNAIKDLTSGNNELSNMLFQSMFFQQYSKVQNTYYGYVYNRNDKKIQPINLNEQTAKKSINSIFTIQLNKTLSNFKGSLSQQFAEYSKYLSNLFSKHKSTNNMFTKMTIPILNELGLEIDNNIIRKINAEDRKQINDNIINFFTNEAKFLANADSNKLLAYKQNGLSENGSFNKIISILSPYLTNDINFSTYTVDNKRLYSLQLWNYVSKQIHSHNKQNPNNKLNLINLTDFKDRGNKAEKLNKLNEKDLINIMIANAEQGIAPYIFTGDKSTFLGIQGLTQLVDSDYNESIKLYTNIFKDELQQYIKYKDNALNIEPNYFAISQDFSPLLVEKYKQEIKDINSNNINEFTDSFIRDNESQLKRDIESFVIKQKDDLVDYVTNAGVPIDNKGRIGNTSVTPIALHNFFTEAMYKQTKLFVGDLGFYKNGADFLKRATGAMGTKATMLLDKSFIDKFNNELAGNGMKFSKTFNSIVYDDLISSNLDIMSLFANSSQKQLIEQAKQTGIIPKELKKLPYGEINVADASGFIHIDALRFQLLAENKWSFDLERLYLADKNGTFKADDSTKFVNTLNTALKISTKKPQYFGKQLLEDGSNVNTFYKLSVLPLTRTLARTSTPLKEMEKMMMDRNIQTVMFESANKVGRKSIKQIDDKGKITKLPVPFYKSDRTFNKDVDDDLIQTTYWNYWGTQLDVDDVIKEEQTIGTQMRKLIFSNLTEILGRDRAIDIWNNFNETEVQRIEAEYEELSERLNIVDNKVDINKVRDILIEEAISRNVNTDFVNQIVYLLSNDRGLDLATNRLKMQSLLYSLVTNNIIKPKVPGTSLPQVSTAGIANLQFNTQDGTIVKQSNNNILPELKFYEIGEGKYGMEVYLPNYLKSFVPLGELDSRLLELIAFRIPTQGFNSIEKLVVKGFLPANQGSAIVVPKEITTKAGSDFDIDKLNIYLPSFYVDNNNKVNYIEPYVDDKTTYKQYFKYLRTANFSLMGVKEEKDFTLFVESIADNTISDSDITNGVERFNNVAKKYNMKPLITFKQFKLNAINNKSLRQYVDIIDETKTNEKLRQLLLTPNTDETIKNLAKDGSKSVRSLYGGSNNISYSSLLTLPQHIKSKVSFNGGKNVLGSIALHNTHHIIGQLTNLKLNNAYSIKLFNNNQKAGELNKTRDEKGRYISDIISEFMNASVDVAKDDYITDINLTLDTANTYMYLIRNGVNIEKVVYFMSQPILKEYTKQYNLLSSITSNEVISPSQLHQMSIDRLKQRIKEYSELNEISLGDNISENKLIEQIELKDWRTGEQLNILSQFEKYYSNAYDLFKLMQATNFDTKSAGTNEIENRELVNRYDRFIKENQDKAKAQNVYFTTGNGRSDLREIFDNEKGRTFIGKMRDIVRSTNGLFSDLFKYNNPKYQAVMKAIQPLIQYLPLDKKIKIENKLINELITYVVQNMNQGLIGKRYDYITNEIPNQILSIQNRKVELDNMIKSDNLDERRQAREELANDPMLNNAWLNAVKIDVVNDDYVISYKAGNTFSTIVQEELLSAFHDIYKQNPSFAYGIIYHNIFQNGFSNSPLQLFNAIPNQYVLDVAENYYNIPNLNYNDFITKFVLNNYAELLPYRSEIEIMQNPFGSKNYYNYTKTSDNQEQINIHFQDNTFVLKEGSVRNSKRELVIEHNGIYRRYYIQQVNTDEGKNKSNNWFNNINFEKINC